MKKRVVIAMFSAVALASMLSLALFYLVTVSLSDAYVHITGKLIHIDESTNKALLDLVSQASVLGGLGGALFVFQQITNYIAHGRLFVLLRQELENYFLYAFIIPLKGLIAGLIGGTIVGGTIMLVGGIEALRNAHLLVIGAGCLAGYSEQFLQRVVALADRNIDKL